MYLEIKINLKKKPNFYAPPMNIKTGHFMHEMEWELDINEDKL